MLIDIQLPTLMDATTWNCKHYMRYESRNCSQNARELLPKQLIFVTFYEISFYYVIMGVVSGCDQGVPKARL